MATSFAPIAQSNDLRGVIIYSMRERFRNMSLRLAKMGNMRCVLTFSMAVLLLLAVGNASAQTTVSSAATGNWNSRTTWGTSTNRTGTVATSTASVLVTGTGTVFTSELAPGAVLTTQGDVAIGTVLSIQSDTQLTLTGNSAVTLATSSYRTQYPCASDAVSIINGFTVTENINAACSSLSFQNNTVFSNTLTISGTNSLVVSGAIDLPRGFLIGVNTLAVNAGTLSAGSIGFTNGGISHLHVLTISTGTVLIAGNVTQTGSTGSATITFTGAGLLKVGGSFLNSSTGTLNSSPGCTVEYNGAAQTIGDFAYSNLTLSNSGIKTFLTGTAVNGNLTLSGTASATTVANFSIGGNLDVGSGAAFTVSANRTLGVTGTTSVSGTLTLAGTGTKTFGGSVVVNTGGVWSETGNSAYSFAGSLQNDGTFTANAGIHTFSGAGMTFSGSNTITIPSVTISGTGSQNGVLSVGTALSGGGTLTQGPGATLFLGGTSGISTLVATGSNNAVIYNGGVQVVKAITYEHLVILNTGVKTLAGDILVQGILNIFSGTLDAAGHTITLAGPATPLIVTGTLNPASVIYTSASGAYITGGITYTNLTINSTGQIFAAAGDVTVESVLNVQAGVFDGVTSTITLMGSGTPFVVTDTFNPSASTVVYSSLSGALVTAVPYTNLIINGSGVFTAANSFAVSKDLTLATGTFDDGGNVITVNGNIINSAAHTGTGEILLTGSALDHVLSGIGTFTSIEVNDPFGATFVSDIHVNGLLSLTNGNLSTPLNNTVTIGSAGDVTRGSGYVVGNLRKVYGALGSKVFEIGTSSGYSPVTVDVTSGIGSFTASATETPEPFAVDPNTVLHRFWTLSGNVGSVDLQFAYVFPGDVNGDETSYILGRDTGFPSWTYPGGRVDSNTHTASISGVVFYSGNWTAGERHGLNGPATQAIVVLPGQTLTPAVGLTGSPSSQTAGTTFTADVKAVDSNFNVDPSVNGPVSITTSDPNDVDPAPTTFSAGVATFSITNMTADANQSIAPDATPLANITSSAYTVIAHTSSTLACSPNPGVVGSPVNCSVTVAAYAPAFNMPTGTVDIFVDGSLLAAGTGTLVSGSCVIPVTLPFGAHTLVAVYNGTPIFFSSTSNSVSESIEQPSTTTLVSNVTPYSVFGQPVVFTATVADTLNPTQPVSGAVLFSVNGQIVSMQTLLKNSAQFTTSSLPVAAANQVEVQFVGNGTFLASSALVTQQVNKAATTTTVVPSGVLLSGAEITLTASVATTAPGAGTPAGTVQFFDGATSLSPSITVVSGSAAYTTNTLTVSGNIHSITAVYSGNSDFATSTSVAASVMINPASTSTTLTATPAASIFGQSVVLSATVTAVAPGSGIPTSTVTFMDGAATLGTATLSSGVATFSTAALTVGSHPITAVYGGDSEFNPSTSSISNVVVSALPIPAIISLSPPKVLVGSAGLNILVNGSNFDPLSVVKWNGASRPTTFVSSTLLIAAIPASDLAAVGIVPVLVTNSPLATSVSTNFTVANPEPVVITMTPAIATAGDPPLVISLTGINFVSTSTVNFGGVAISTVFVNSNALTATIPAAKLAVDGTVGITVVNPGPGGGTSNSESFVIGKFTVNSPPTATPNPTHVGQTVAFSVSATNTNNDAISFAWDFGDSTAGAGPTPTHTYSALGTYTATVTITASSGAKIVATVNVVVETPDIGGGALPPGTFKDTNGSGIPDEMLSAAATVGISTVSSSKPLPKVRLAIKLNFATSNSDSITLSAMLDKTGAGKPLVINVGGVIKAFTLDATGKAKSGGDSVAVSPKTGKLAARFMHGSFAAQLLSSGLTNATVSGVSLSIRVGTLFNNSMWFAQQPQLYKATQGKSGATR